MKIIISKLQWESIGCKTGWIKTAQSKTAKIINDIRKGLDPFFGLSHFHTSNMADYELMSSTISDMTSVYGINEEEAASIIQTLTHE